MATPDRLLSALQTLVAVVAQLRSPEGGCPWDRAQTPQTLIPFVLEEAYETVDAIRSGNPQAIAEELGDLLLQVVLQAQIAREIGQFDLADVAQGITAKLIRRHPHVFAGAPADDIDAVTRNWEAIKAAEKGEDLQARDRLGRKFERDARTLPPLTAALKISRQAAAVGFDWDRIEDIWTKVDEELAEFHEALDKGDRDHAEAEFGDILFALVQIARWHGIDPAEALRGTNARFAARFATMETLSATPLQNLAIADLERLWQQAKQVLQSSEQS